MKMNQFLILYAQILLVNPKLALFVVTQSSLLFLEK